MLKSSLKVPARQFYRSVMNHTMREYDGNNLGRSALIFSPHQDDETLGCGGTIIQKKRAGADLKIVFMTDGCRSHSHLMPEDELKSIRKNEALAASYTLGVEKQNVVFLDFKDGTLDKNQEAAIEKVTEILLHYPPDEIFIPCHQEAPSDHSVTNQVVLSALKICKLNITVYEYPIWLWRHWPLTSLVGSWRENLSILKNSLIAGFGLNLLKDFRCSVYIGDVLELKRAALDQHKSQMQRLIPQPNWLTLADVSNGEFLECFFQDYEIFRQYQFN